MLKSIVLLVTFRQYEARPANQMQTPEISQPLDILSNVTSSHSSPLVLALGPCNDRSGSTKGEPPSAKAFRSSNTFQIFQFSCNVGWTPCLSLMPGPSTFHLHHPILQLPFRRTCTSRSKPKHPLHNDAKFSGLSISPPSHPPAS